MGAEDEKVTVLFPIELTIADYFRFGRYAARQGLQIGEVVQMMVDACILEEVGKDPRENVEVWGP